MKITKQVLINKGINLECSLAERYLELYPDGDGLDISPLLGTKEETEQFWLELLKTDLNKMIGWAIFYGLIPSRILADLSEVDLSGANLSGANLRGAAWNDDTIWPDGFEPESGG